MEAVVTVRSSELGVWSEGETLKGYEIHMGRTTGDVGLFNLKRCNSHSALRSPYSVILDGSAKGSVWGTYIHGIFDNDAFRHGLIDVLRVKRGLVPAGVVANFAKSRDAALDKWAAVLLGCIDMKFIRDLIA